VSFGNLLERINASLDRKTGEHSRQLARQTSRRSFLGRLGTGIVGMSALPLLPVLRAFGADEVDELGDPKSCDYWRYCAVSGTLCACCGGTLTSCPPGAELSPITWVGTCHNPADDRDYLISYNDCCGKAVCSRCDCHRTEREKPLYSPSRHASITWCFGTESRSYHCTMALVIGEAN
jgi:methylamine dehydrogenase light chain